MRIPTPSKSNPLVSMGPCPEILLEDRVVRFRKPFPRMAMVAHGQPAIYVFHAQDESGAAPVPKAVTKRYERFNKTKSRAVHHIKLELSGWKPIGKCKGVVYCSNKEGLGAEQEYVHAMEVPHPDVFISADGNAYVITGGRFTIDEWIEG